VGANSETRTSTTLPCCMQHGTSKAEQHYWQQQPSMTQVPPPVSKHPVAAPSTSTTSGRHAAPSLPAADADATLLQQQLECSGSGECGPVWGSRCWHAEPGGSCMPTGVPCC
jgi:hypothetical protein